MHSEKYLKEINNIIETVSPGASRPSAGDTANSQGSTAPPWHPWRNCEDSWWLMYFVAYWKVYKNVVKSRISRATIILFEILLLQSWVRSWLRRWERRLRVCVLRDAKGLDRDLPCYFISSVDLALCEFVVFYSLTILLSLLVLLTDK